MRSTVDNIKILFSKQPKHFCFDHKRDIVLHMFPKELHFNIHPRELQQAVELLPDIKGYVRHSASASAELKNKLLQVPVEKLRLWKMKPKMLAKLPYLVIEKENKALLLFLWRIVQKRRCFNYWDIYMERKSSFKL